GQTKVDVGEAESRAFAHPGLEHPLDRIPRDAAAVVPHRHPEAAATHARPHEQVEGPVGLSVLDRVLDEGLDKKRGQAHAERVRCSFDGHAELRAEARLFELEVAVHVPQFLLERDELAWTCETTA